MTFRVGQKVVCVDDTRYPFSRTKFDRPAKGSIYTVRDVVSDFIPGQISLRLVELKNPAIHWSDGTYCEAAFRASRFRPIVERKTSIEIFKRMLLPQGVDA